MKTIYVTVTSVLVYSYELHALRFYVFFTNYQRYHTSASLSKRTFLSQVIVIKVGVEAAGVVRPTPAYTATAAPRRAIFLVIII